MDACICRENAPSICGIFRSGGWQDTGDLLMDRVRVIDAFAEDEQSPGATPADCPGARSGGWGRAADSFRLTL
jgi:hypothetical protein